ncbi:hypothetical protein C4D60_Mb11t18300 [Musa balbisiana]|uniref:Uncharacterized protein n=1 Tax=Musa balbisiana TaxID=52838 RepID=A0A4S8J513_MUSBA|nr:hypothetical protein C4D60_Mb11t18300 [Musa balbisiana]
MDLKSECHGTVEASLPCVHRILHQMKALVISIYGLCTTEKKFRMQVPVSPMGRLDHTEENHYEALKGSVIEKGARARRGEARPKRLANVPGGALQTGAAWALARAQALGSLGERLGKPRRPNQDFRSGSVLRLLRALPRAFPLLAPPTSPPASLPTARASREPSRCSRLLRALPRAFPLLAPPSSPPAARAFRSLSLSRCRCRRSPLLLLLPLAAAAAVARRCFLVSPSGSVCIADAPHLPDTEGQTMGKKVIIWHTLPTYDWMSMIPNILNIITNKVYKNE